MRVSISYRCLPLSLIIVSTLLVLSVVDGKNVLVLIPMSPKSHIIVFDSIAKGLAGRGHNVTLVTGWERPPELITSTTTSSSSRNLKSIVIPPGFDFFSTHNIMEVRRLGIWGLITFTKKEIYLQSCRRILKARELRGLDREEFDVILTDVHLNECTFGLVHKLRSPFIWVSTQPLDSLRMSFLGNRLPPSFVPDTLLPYTDLMSFFQRVLNTVFRFGFAASYGSIYSDYEDFYREHFGKDLPGIEEISKDVSLVLSNSHFSINQPRPGLPDVVEIGGVHCRPGKALPKDIEDFISRGSHGFIYFSLGSIAKPHELSSDRQRVFINTFRRLSKYQVLWKWPNETIPDLPDNVKLLPWAPQQDILAHPNIKLFMTHGGLLSIQEATYHGVPVVALPLFGDQDGNAIRAQEAGVGEMVEILDVTAASLVKTIWRVINNPEYKRRAQTLSKLFKDREESPLKKAIFWTEYIMRHKGAKHLRSAARGLNFFEYYSIDVSLFLFGLAGMVSWLLYKIFRRILNLLLQACIIVDTEKKEL